MELKGFNAIALPLNDERFLADKDLMVSIFIRRILGLGFLSLAIEGALLCASLLTQNPPVGFDSTSPRIFAPAYAMDERQRRLQKAVEAGEPGAMERYLCERIRAGTLVRDALQLIRMDQVKLNENAGEFGSKILAAVRERATEPAHLGEIQDAWREEAKGWYHERARTLQVGDQFITRWRDGQEVTEENGYRWTLVWKSETPRPPREGEGQPLRPGGREVWRAPNGNLVGDVIGSMNHYDAQRIDRALSALYAQAEYKDGVWKWPETMMLGGEEKPFDPAEFLRAEMQRDIAPDTLPGGDPWGVPTGNVSRYYDSLMDSIGGILAPDFPWRVPEQVGYGINNPGLTRQMSELRQLGAIEVLPDMKARWFWSSSLHADYTDSAHDFSGHDSGVHSLYRDSDNGSLRLIARPR